MQMALPVGDEIEFPWTFEQGAVSGLPAMDDFAVHVDEKRPEELPVKGSKKGQARLRQCPIVNGDAARPPGAANLVSIRSDQVAYIFDVDQRLRNHPIWKAPGSGGEVSVAESADEKKKGCR